jgi:hypothetical protein
LIQIKLKKNPYCFYGFIDRAQFSGHGLSGNPRQMSHCVIFNWMLKASCDAFFGELPEKPAKEDDIQWQPEKNGVKPPFRPTSPISKR